MKQELGPQAKTHELFVKREILPYIIDGTKKYEIRVLNLDHRYENVRDIKVGDTIKFSDGAGETISKKVLAVTHHPNLENFLEEVDAEDVMPGMSDKDILERWGDMFGRKEKRFGVIVFTIN